MRGMQYHEAGRELAAATRHFALSAAVFLHSDMNFLRSLPWTPLGSASFEHSSDAAERGFSAFLGAAILASGAGAAEGAGVWANSDRTRNRAATAVPTAPRGEATTGASHT